jgi:hypothetical protein
VSVREAAAAGVTEIVSVPRIVDIATSVAVIVCVPARTSVDVKVPCPCASVASLGSTTPAAVSLLVKWIVPAYCVSTLPNWSCALTLNEKLLPAVTLALLESASVVAAAARTDTVTLPLSADTFVSVAVMVCEPALIRVAENVPCPFSNVVSAGSTTPPA